MVGTSIVHTHAGHSDGPRAPMEKCRITGLNVNHIRSCKFRAVGAKGRFVKTTERYRCISSMTRPFRKCYTFYIFISNEQSCDCLQTTNNRCK